MGDRILEVGGAGIEGMDEKVKALMNNMVNSETPGYRKSDVVIKSFSTYLDEANRISSTQVPRVEGVHYNQNSGTLLRTGNKLDLAIGDNGFFVVKTPWGEGYTRDGRFAINKDGYLVTVSGNYPVIGLDGQTIQVDPGSDVNFTGTGIIRVKTPGVDVVPKDVNTIKIVNVNDPAKLESINGTVFKLPNSAETSVNDTPRIVSGYVEASNVNIIEEMMNLIYLSRAYGIDSKIISNRDTMLTSALEIGRPAQ